MVFWMRLMCEKAGLDLISEVVARWRWDHRWTSSRERITRHNACSIGNIAWFGSIWTCCNYLILNHWRQEVEIIFANFYVKSLKLFKREDIVRLHQYVILGSFAILVYFSSRQLYIPTYNCFSLAAEVTNKLCKLTPTSSSITTFDGKVQIYYSGVKSAFCQKRDCFLWLFQMPASSGRLGLWE